MEKNLKTAIAPLHAPKLTQLPVTAICGNDITYSCLYVSALPLFCRSVCLDRLAAGGRGPVSVPQYLRGSGWGLVLKRGRTRLIKIVNILGNNDHPPEKLIHEVEVLDRAYPDLDVDFILMRGHFGPELIQQLSDEWKIPKDFMCIGSPGDRFIDGLEESGGVRLII